RELAKRYRPEGWTIRQLVHHCADSHMNSFIRFKLTLTEETPTIKPYLEDLWAELPDASHLPIDSSLDVLKGLHHRWTALLKSLTEEDLKRQFIHPETNERISLETNIGIYAWNGDHHLAHMGQMVVAIPGIYTDVCFQRNPFVGFRMYELPFKVFFREGFQ